MILMDNLYSVFLICIPQKRAVTIYVATALLLFLFLDLHIYHQVRISLRQ